MSVHPTPCHMLSINNIRVPVFIDPVTGDALLLGWDARWYYGDSQDEVNKQLKEIERQSK